MNRPGKPLQKGFTLLEMVVALALTAAIMGLIYGTLHSAMQSWRVINQTTQQHNQQFLLLQHLRQQLQQARLIKDFDGTNEILRFSGSKSELKFITTISPLQRDAGLYQYTLTAGNDQQQPFTLQIEPYQPLLNGDAAEQISEVIILPTGGSSVQFSYSDSTQSDESDWLDHWSVNDRLPQLVKITAQDSDLPQNWLPFTVAIRGTGMHYKPTQDGIALISVLWLVTILSLLATALVASQRTETQSTIQVLQQAQARQSAEAAIHKTIFQLMNKTIQPSSASLGALETFTFADYKIQIELISEAGKADINKISEPLLRSIITSLEIDAQHALALTDAIMDWRDGDELVRLNGAERRDYQRANLSFLPTNRPFQELEELQRVMGMTPAIYLQLMPLLTVHSNQPGIDMAAASPVMLKALGQEPAPSRQFMSASSARLLAINATASRSNQPLVELRTTVALNPSVIQQPFNFLAWKFSPPGITEQTLEILQEQGDAHAAPQG